MEKCADNYNAITQDKLVEFLSKMIQKTMTKLSGKRKSYVNKEDYLEKFVRSLPNDIVKECDLSELIIKCPIIDCGKLIQRNQITEHFKTDCIRTQFQNNNNNSGKSENTNDKVNKSRKIRLVTLKKK